MIRDRFILRGFVVGRFLLVAWLALAGVAGCSDGKRGEPADAWVQTQVAVEDRLRVSIFELVTPGETWTGDLVVDKDGFVDLPNLGKVRVEGLSTDEVEKVLGEKASGDPVPGRSLGPEVKVEKLRSKEGGASLFCCDRNETTV